VAKNHRLSGFRAGLAGIGFSIGHDANMVAILVKNGLILSLA